MKKILLVDDDEFLHPLYREELEKEGYETHSALTGEEALSHLDIIKPDLIILDINMPGMSGIEALRRIKEISPHIPVILYSAYQEFKHNLASWASEEYVVKSADLGELKAAVNRHITGYK